MSHAPPNSLAARSFWRGANDLSAREWPFRASRFIRARARQLLLKALLLVEDPRVVRAWRQGWDADHYIQLRRWADNGFWPKVIYDIGAHHGAWSEMAAQIFQPEQIILFEPHPEHASLLRNRRPPADRSWRVLELGLGAEEQELKLHITRNSAASSLLPPLAGGKLAGTAVDPVSQRIIRVARLDDLVKGELLPTPDLVKIDVQGFELAVLQGGELTFSHARRLCVEVSLLPIYQGQPLFADVVTSLKSMGFRLENATEAFRNWPSPQAQLDLWCCRD